MKYEYVLLDLDGTLTDPEEGITKSIRYALASFGIEECDRSKLRSFIGPPLKSSFQDFYGMSDENADLAIARYRERFADKGLYENTVYPGVEKLLASLKEAGISVALATSKPTVYALRILEHFDLDGYFDFALGSELDGTRTAKADVVAGVVAHFAETDRAKFVMVGDRSHDMVGARSNGIDSIGVLYGYGSREELVESKATYIAESIDGLSRLLCN
ncbi:HAD hydrolase-like protein [Raoultibacter timonensis]|uniref:Phosphoglycolate phosphatase n=1 Tax=Raoultibacter timonensis TaxID=1907662 RepID=A0ABN6M9T0_9ACTN|nr:HAD hydrolase-like protein [Raoultibacter timonensis]BDE94770.1 phosphoglycolate phosphatase [Raoultibacter timonensis]BDF49373.1 phosphoglycolate phosphatase [Raoultibacter timonensis]